MYKSEKVWKIQFIIIPIGNITDTSPMLIMSLNHDLRVPLEPGPGEYLLIRQTKCGRSSADDDRPTRIAGITFDLEQVPVAFINSRHVSRIRGWCSCSSRNEASHDRRGNKKGTRWSLQYVQSFFYTRL